MERRESKTPAGDMWHVLNINRRVEAAEAAIMGMTNLIDTINVDIDELRNNPIATFPKQQPEDGVISKQGQDMVKKMAAKMKSLDGKLTEVDQKMADFISKDQPQVGCTTEQVKEMIEGSLEKFQATLEMPSHIPTTVAAEPVKIKKESSTVLKKSDSKLSGALIAYQEVSGKMLILEQEINKAKVRISQLEVELENKLVLGNVEDKADKLKVTE